MRTQLIVAVALLSAACGDPVSPDDARVPAFASLVGDGIQRPVATVVDVTVKVTDSLDVPVPNRLVNFVVTKGGGSVFAGSALTDANGNAKEVWTLGTVAGEQMLEARWVDPNGRPVVLGTITATADPGPEVTPATKAPSDVVMFAGSDVTIAEALGVTPGKDAYGNARPLSLSLAVPEGMSLLGQRLAVNAPGVYAVGVTEDGVARTITVRVVEELSKHTWVMSWRCAGSTQVDSTMVTMSTTKVKATRTPGVAQVALPIEFTFTGTRLTWMKDASTSTPSVTSETWTATQTPDSLVFPIAGAQRFRRTGALTYESTDTRCAANTYEERGATQLKKQ